VASSFPTELRYGRTVATDNSASQVVRALQCLHYHFVGTKILFIV
jgi:hypothetical protein